ncbi:MAG: hypothetical protein HY787_25075 [Deltaproteobacteria bacterium]|nr:hypothetical protein [Deltaproteobacteria bacterium]
MIDIAKRIVNILTTVSISALKGEKVIRNEGWSLEKYSNTNIQRASPIGPLIGNGGVAKPDK